MDIKTFSPTSHKIKAVIYGASGSGKTYFAATAPKPIFASAEGGLLSTRKHKKKIGPIKYVKIEKIEDLKEMLTILRKGEHQFETVVIDSITEINEIIKENIERKRGAQMQLKDWGDLAKAIKMVLRGFRDLDMHVIFIAQEKTEKDDQKTEKIVPSLNGKAANEIAYFMDIVAYAFLDSMDKHRITVQPSHKLLTKARGIELPADAPDDFEEWIKAMQEIEIVDEEETETVVVALPPKAPAPKPSQPPKAPTITNETSQALFSAWQKFYDSLGKDPKQRPIYLRETLKKEFGVDSSRLLSEEQAKSFTDRLVAANKKREAEAREHKKIETKTENKESKGKEEISQAEEQAPVLTGTPEQGKV